MLSAIIAFSCMACNKDSKEEEKNTGNINETSTMLVKDGESDFVVVKPEKTTTALEFAVSELVNFFADATGCELIVRNDKNYSYDENQKIISVGETNPYRQSGITLDFDEFYEDGAYLETKGNQVFLCGARDTGTINAVYDFLQYHFNFEVYSYDEIYIDRVSEAKLLNFDKVKDIPAIRTRAGGPAAMSSDDLYCVRMRHQKGGNGSRYGVGKEYAAWAHTVQYMVPESKYGETHPEWYGTKNNVALPMYFLDETGEFKNVILDNVKQSILDNPTSTAFQFGMNDNTGNCDNEFTKEWTKARGGYGGALMAFANGVARDIVAWLKEVDPERAEVFRFSILAYISYESAPVKFDEATQKYVPVHPDVVADDNVSVMICPYYANHNYAYDHQRNNRYKNCFEQWSVCAKHMEVWYYTTNYSCYMTPFNNFQTLKENALVYRNYNVSYIMDNGTGTNATPFQIMRNYLMSKLWWNPDLDVNKLVDDFIYYYYKDAAPYVKEYYDLIRLNYAALEAQYAEDGKYFPGGMYETDIQAGTTVWSLGFTRKTKSVLEQAAEAASKIKNEVEREKILFRVKCESLTPRFFFLEHHSTTVSVEECKSMIDSFEADASECGLTKWRESKGDIATKIDEWRTNLAVWEE